MPKEIDYEVLAADDVERLKADVDEITKQLLVAQSFMVCVVLGDGTVDVHSSLGSPGDLALLVHFVCTDAKELAGIMAAHMDSQSGEVVKH